ncbi:MAG: TerB family tellurite resistance protein [Bacteroidales bacterium]|nr:TerB family tellurite resistance protein [Bacteroidales bacterium]
MMEEFTQKEKEAVVSVLCVLTKVDYRVRDKENQVLETCIKELGCDTESFQPIPRNQLEKQAYETLKSMSKRKKRVLSRMMTKIARSDGHFGPLERAFAIEIMEMCDIPFVHR